MDSNLQPTLNQAAEELFEQMELSDYLEVLAEGIYRNHEWNVGASNSRGEAFESENMVTEKALQSVWTGLQPMVGLTKIHEAYEREEKGGSNE